MIRAWLAVLLLAFLATPTHAHENLPLVVELAEQGDGRYVLVARAPGNRIDRGLPGLTLAGPCERGKPVGLAQQFTCETRPAALEITPPATGTAPPVLLRARFADASRLSATAPPGATRLELPAVETAGGVLGGYVAIGAAHILEGFDHLLFLTCLVLLCGTWQRTAITVTGFTLGHALTITLATLGMIRVNSGAVEAVIALSIAFLAAELLRTRRDGLVFRYPAAIAALFGLLHGLGFAGALAAIGTAQTRPLLSLLGFNLGVEAGQVLFVSAVLGLGLVLRRVSSAGAVGTAWPPVRTLVLSAIGLVAGYWFAERMMALIL